MRSPHLGLLRQSSLLPWLILLLGAIALVLSSRVVAFPDALLAFAKATSLIAVAVISTFFILNRVIGLERTNEAFKNLVLVIVTTIIMAGISEWAVRIVFADITTTNDNGTYFARRWQEKAIRTNTLGFREREFVVLKPPQTYRMAVIGDSFTYGQGIEEAERFTNIMEVALNQKSSHRQYEVLNFGKPGAQTADETKTFKDVVLRVQPDFVLLQWFVNDVEGPEHHFQYDVVPLIPSHSLAQLFHKSSALYFLMENGWNTLQSNLGMTARYENFLQERFQDVNSPASKAYLTVLKQFIELAKDNDISVAIVLFPYLMANLDREYPFAFLHEHVQQVCAIEHVPCIDLRSTFAPYSRAENPDGLHVNQFDYHPNGLANALAAKRIQDELVSITTIKPLRLR